MSQNMPDSDTYALVSDKAASIDAPVLDYQPPQPRAYKPRIALIGAGGIAAAHLDAYRTAGFDVAVICNRTLSKAEARRDEFFPDAKVTDNIDEVLADESLQVLDITPHPAERIALIKRALLAKKHVLSQKPFVLDLAVGEQLVQLAEDNGVKLAVNQNGRWAPHMAYMRLAVQAGLIGELASCHSAIHWDHRWIAGTPFEKINDVIFYDFAIHWFDFLASVAGDRVQSVYATTTRSHSQPVVPPLFCQALVRLDGGQASLVFDAATPFGSLDSTYIAGSHGSLMSTGPDLGEQCVTLATEAGQARPTLDGTWFNDGFRGAMGELLCAIEQDRQPYNNARDNLKSLAIVFAAIRSAREGVEVEVSDVQDLLI
jgi:predicted dehydrogenase